MPGRRRVLALAAAALAAPRVVRSDMPLDAEVAVVGAGAAGIAAARRLVAWDYEVVLLEARDRVGGRAWTDASALGLPWDAGAQWLHNGGLNPLARAARDLGLRLTPSRYEDMSVTGSDAPDAALRFMQAFGPVEDAIDRLAEEAGHDATLAAVPTATAWEAGALRLSAMSMGGDPGDVSLLDTAALVSGEDRLVDGGPGGLLTALADGLPVRTGHTVTAIDLRAAGFVTLSGGFGSLRAGVVIVTLPPAVLASGAVRFTPALPPAKAAAFAALGPAEFLKVGLRLERRPPGAAEFAVDMPSLLEGEGALLHLDPRAPLANVIFCGARARALRSEGRAATVAGEVLRQHTGLRAVAAATHDWTGDPLSLGPWARPLPGAATARQDYAAPVEGRLFFAGEAAPGPMATSLGGAWTSGLAAAEAVWEAT
ncbi:flavin monoamine oxidase family protein [Roseicyclus sp.]|uniref:flavin monoamine oxidase family protein n=1 Tax=Roseicyclus sp. TaxID=1914329 RepID=UPI003FA1025F